MSTLTSQDVRCPRCAAHVRAGSHWCTLCYTDLRPAPPEPVAPVGEPPAEPAPAVPVAKPRGKHARRPDAGDKPAEALSQAEMDTMLAQLAAAEGGAPLGRFSRHVDTKGKQLAVMVGGAAAVSFVIFVLLVVLGALL